MTTTTDDSRYVPRLAICLIERIETTDGPRNDIRITILDPADLPSPPDLPISPRLFSHLLAHVVTEWATWIANLTVTP